jgi:hypothetical protein
MQQLLIFGISPASETEPTSDVWSTLPSQARCEALGALARLLAKTTTQSIAPKDTEQRRETGDAQVRTPG